MKTILFIREVSNLYQVKELQCLSWWGGEEDLEMLVLDLENTFERAEDTFASILDPCLETLALGVSVDKATNNMDFY